MSRRRRPASGGREAGRAEEELRVLEEFLRSFSIQVTYDRRVEGKGGACRVRGDRRIILQQGLPASEKADLLLDAIRRLDVTGVEVPEPVRRRIEGIEKAREAPSSEPR